MKNHKDQKQVSKILVIRILLRQVRTRVCIYIYVYVHALEGMCVNLFIFFFYAPASAFASCGNNLAANPLKVLP